MAVKNYFVELIIFSFLCYIVQFSLFRRKLYLCFKAKTGKRRGNTGISFLLQLTFKLFEHSSFITPLISMIQSIFLFLISISYSFLQKKAKSLIEEFINNNQTLLATPYGLGSFKYKRHNTYYHKKCICQYLEPHILSDDFIL